MAHRKRIAQFDLRPPSYDSPQVEFVSVYRDMAARDLLQRRETADGTSRVSGARLPVRRLLVREGR